MQLVLGLGGAVLLVLLVRRVGGAAIWDALAGIHPRFLLLDAGVVTVIFVGMALRWRALLRGLGVRAGLRPLLGIRLAGLSVGTLTPGAKLGGEPLRAYLLARDGVPTGAAIATVAVDRGVELLANVVYAVLYCVLFASRDADTAGRALVLVAVAAVALALVIWFAVRRLGAGAGVLPARFLPVMERLGAGRAALAEVDAAFRTLLLDSRPLVYRSFGWALVLNALIFLDYATIFAAFGHLPEIPQLAGAMLGVGLAHALPIPASLGALEGAQAAIFEWSGESERMGVVAAAVARIRDLIWTLPGLLYLGWRWIRGRRALKPW